MVFKITVLTGLPKEDLWNDCTMGEQYKTNKNIKGDFTGKF